MVGSHPNGYLAIGTTMLFLGAAIALVMARPPYTEAGWSKGMKRVATWAAYAGALLVFMGTFEELEPHQTLLKVVMLALALLILVFLLVAALFLWLRGLRRENGPLWRYIWSALINFLARRKKDSVQQPPSP